MLLKDIVVKQGHLALWFWRAAPMFGVQLANSRATPLILASLLDFRQSPPLLARGPPFSGLSAPTTAHVF